MHTFYFIEKKQPNKLMRLVMAILCLIISITKFVQWYNEPKTLNIFVAFMFMISGFSYYFSWFKPHKKSYITINEILIEWLLPGENSVKKLNWSDILRVKFEDDGVSLYQQSSFCNFISFKNLEEADRQIIKELIEHRS